MSTDVIQLKNRAKGFRATCQFRLGDEDLFRLEVMRGVLGARAAEVLREIYDRGATALEAELIQKKLL